MSNVAWFLYDWKLSLGLWFKHFKSLNSVLNKHSAECSQFLWVSVISFSCTMAVDFVVPF